jgi:peptidoglycan/LPS O-acetylase OafA/YrhL
MTPAATPADRYHALDSLRGFAMFLGIVLHAGISFTAQPVAFWLSRDTRSTPLADIFLFAIHDFRMQVFFLLAGFFGCLLYLKYGARGTARHRVKRVLVPFVLSLVFIVPTVMTAFLYVELANTRAEGVPENATRARRYVADLIAANPDASDARLILDRFADGTVVVLLRPIHLWFLYFLLIFYAVALLAAPLLEKLSGTRPLAKLDALFRRLVEGRWRVVLPAAVTFPVLLLMKTPVPIVDTQFEWTPELHLLLYYGGFFAFGWMLFRHRDLVPGFGRRWRSALAVANLLVLPVMLVTLGGFVEAKKDGADTTPWRVAAFTAQAAYTWLMIVGLWGAFLHLFGRGSAWTRYLADASYWCYLASITPTILFQFWVKDWPLPAEVKWPLVSVAVLAVLLASYEWCVRYTFVGAILNGRKYRPRDEDVGTQGASGATAVAPSDTRREGTAIPQ